MPCMINCIQARSQGTFDVEALSGRGFGAALEADGVYTFTE